MFSIYDSGSRVFRNTLEELYRVEPLIAAEEPGKQREILSGENEYTVIQNNAYAPSSNAIQAYRDLVSTNPKEQIHHAFEIMDDQFRYVTERQPALEAFRLMESEGVDVLPVLNAEKRIVGIFSAEIAVKKLIEADTNVKSYMLNPVKSFIENKVITAEPVTSIRRIAEVMNRGSLKVIPIVDSYETVVGIVSYREVLKVIANDPPMNLWT